MDHRKEARWPDGPDAASKALWASPSILPNDTIVEHAFWFKDRGWDVEGNGVEPDVELDISPADHAAGRDP